MSTRGLVLKDTGQLCGRASAGVTTEVKDEALEVDVGLAGAGRGGVPERLLRAGDERLVLG